MVVIFFLVNLKSINCLFFLFCKSICNYLYSCSRLWQVRWSQGGWALGTRLGRVKVPKVNGVRLGGLGKGLNAELGMVLVG